MDLTESEDCLMDTLNYQFTMPGFDYRNTCHYSCTHWSDHLWEGSIDSLFPGLLDVCCNNLDCGSAMENETNLGAVVY